MSIFDYGKIDDFYRTIPLQSFLNEPPRQIDCDVLIGGPSDGQRTHVLYGRQVIARAPNGERGTYDARRFRAGNTVFNLWVHSPLSAAQAMEMLLSGYRPEPADKDGAP